MTKVATKLLIVDKKIIIVINESAHFDLFKTSGTNYDLFWRFVE